MDSLACVRCASGSMIPLLVPEISPSVFFVMEEELRIIVVGESGDLGPVKTVKAVVTVLKILFIKLTFVMRNLFSIYYNIL